MESDLTIDQAGSENAAENISSPDEQIAIVDIEQPLDTAAVEDTGSFVKMFLSAAGVQFKLHSKVDQGEQSIGLAAQLELALTMLQQAQSRLEAAFIRIGQLESELAVTRQLNEQLMSQGATFDAPPVEER